MPNAVQEAASFSLYSATKLAASDEASVQESVTLVELAAAAERSVGAAGGMVRDTAGLARPPLGFSARTRIS